MAKVIIYTTPICSYCVRAKMLLQKKGAAFEEIDVSNDAELRQNMTENSGGKTSVPQIFIDEKYIGGSDDLYDLENQGKLDELLTT